MNPIKKLRIETLKLSLKEMSLLTDLSYETLVRVENGRVKKIPKKMLEILNGLGYCDEVISLDYGEWLHREQQKVKNSFHTSTK
ncbi:helix-turn-helix transcriptional regulator [Neobacillus sp. 3P2-tot-E-2]|uniref:hypothetical protein n=1 Tax=Neobacillus sp. 3P2-tot-E-2 TaxID=3132212 RepID=UPI0039A172DE